MLKLFITYFSLCYLIFAFIYLVYLFIDTIKSNIEFKKNKKRLEQLIAEDTKKLDEMQKTFNKRTYKIEK